MNDVVFEVSL